MTSVDFALLKRELSIEQVAAWLRLETVNDHQQLRCPCPVNGGGKRALVITPKRGVFYCFAPKCQTGGDLIALVAHCRQIATREAALEIQKAFRSRSEPPQNLENVADYLQPEHDAVQRLGLSPETAAALGIGFAGRGTMKGRVLIPLRTADGALVGYAGFAAALDPPLKVPSKLFV